MLITPLQTLFKRTLNQGCGTVEEGGCIERVVILLSGELCKLQLGEAMFTVAHELAHAFLRHDIIHHFPTDSDPHTEADAKEAAADELAEKRGFPYPHGEENGRAGRKR
ncbi:MAG TPA: ImmA/IrrE family metallo-endopeptidase [Candidatus Binataceae bacterium]|nr:ImmA/IrrE family metallo-endopeptidase [Candidatus Binataceae bacterium]